MWLCGCCDPSDAVDELQVHAEVIAAVPIFNDPAQGSAATLEESRVENEGVEGPTGTQERLREDVRHLLHILAQEGLDVICRKSQNGEIARQTDVRPTDAGSTDERRSAEDIDWNPGIRGRIFVSADCEVSSDKYSRHTRRIIVCCDSVSASYICCSPYAIFDEGEYSELVRQF